MYNWKISGVSLAGKKHLKIGKETQDKIYSKKINGAFGISLADGAGSYEKSEVGAEIVTESSIDYIIKNGNDKNLVKFLSKDKIDKIYNTNFYAPVLIIQSLLKSKKINSSGSKGA